MAEVKPEDMVHHQPMDQLQGFEYCIDSNPSWGMYVMSHTQLVVERCCVHLCIARGSLLILDLLCACYRRRDCVGLPTLHTVPGHCRHDPHLAGSAYGWKWCENPILTCTRVVSWFCCLMFNLPSFWISIAFVSKKEMLLLQYHVNLRLWKLKRKCHCIICLM